MPKTSESWTTQLAQLEAHRRGLEFLETSWLERYPRGKGRFVTIKKDLMGIADAVLFGEGATIALQFTSRANHAARRKKIQASSWLPIITWAGWSVWLWSFNDKGELKEEVIGD